MSALVDYGSSSEEEDGSTHPQATASNNLLNSTPQPSTIDEPTSVAKSDHDDVRPVMGPTMPAGSPEPSAEPILALPEGLSERDMIRHLTQASHPMTSIPDSPPGSPNPAMEAKFERFLELKGKGLHFNEDLVKKSSFKNPSLFENMMDRIGLDRNVQYATNLPSAISVPQNLPAHGYKEELLGSQQNIRDRKKQVAARTIDFVSAKNGGRSTPR